MSEELFDIRSVSLGAGVQSSTMYILAAVGELTPKPDVAIFADTQAEPRWVYQHLDWLEANFGGAVPICRVSAGSLEEATLRSRDGKTRKVSLPLRVMGKEGKAVFLRRQCTREYKIDPIKRELRRMLGLQPRQRAFGRYRVEEWIGISRDEAHRAKPSRIPWITTRWPLLFDKPMRRAECIDWLLRNGFEVPQKSACVFCPFHDDRTWQDLKQNHPEEFARAVEFDRELRKGTLIGVRQTPYLHRELRPLDEIDFGTDTSNQLEIDFGNECEGMCGV